MAVTSIEQPIVLAYDYEDTKHCVNMA